MAEEKEPINLSPHIAWIFREPEIEAELELYQDYLNEMESYLITSIQEHKKNLDNLVIVYDENGEPNSEGEYDSFRIQLLDEFKNILRRWFFVSLFSYFETKLVNECRYRKTKDILLNFSEISGSSNIEKAKIYFSKVLKQKFPSNTKEWQEIQNYRYVRNCIVHNLGELIEFRNEKQLREYIEKNPNIIERYDRIYLGDQFCQEALNTIRKFLLSLSFD